MPLQKSLENTLQDSCKIFITKCSLAKIMREHTKAQENGKTAKAVSRPEFLPPPLDLPLRHCKHNEDGAPIGEEDCLVDLLSGEVSGNQVPRNKHHFVLATAEPPPEQVERQRKSRSHVDLREMARGIPGVPIVYVKRSVMVLEELSGATLRARKSVESEKIREGLVGGVNRKRKRGENDDGSEEIDAEETGKGDVQRRGVKKANGPNPLSVKKKKVRPQQDGGRPVGADGGGAQKAVEEQSDSLPKAKRRRKHGGTKKDEARSMAVVADTTDGVSHATSTAGDS